MHFVTDVVVITTLSCLSIDLNVDAPVLIVFSQTGVKLKILSEFHNLLLNLSPIVIGYCRNTCLFRHDNTKY